MKILFTSVGRRVELIQMFVSAAKKLNFDLTIYGADISDTAPALYFCDEKIKICKIDTYEYIPSLLSICEDEKIDLVIPTIDTDLLILSKNKNLFDSIGTKVLISGEREISLCRDKRKTALFFESIGLKTPKPFDNYSEYKGGFPAFIKPKDGSSSINAFKVDNEKELENYSSQIPDYIVAPYINGKEYTIDIFCDFEGNPIFITPRIRLAVRSGEVLKTEISQDKKIIEEAKKIIKAFNPCGPLTVQLIREFDSNEDYYIEINPRFGGGSPLSMKAGADSSVELLRMLSNLETSYKENAAEDGAIFSRFDQSIRVK